MLLHVADTLKAPEATRSIEQSLDRVVSWVQCHEYKAYEPADGNLSILHQLTFRKTLPMRVLQQIVLRSPLNIRPLLGVKPHEAAIARGYMAWGYVLMEQRQRGTTQRQAVECLDWLAANRAPNYPDFCWGDPYEYATRFGRRPFGEPILVWSSLIGQAFLAAYGAFHDVRHLRIAESIGRWVLSLPRERTPTGVCLSYASYRQSSVHNANLMGAALLAQVGALSRNAEAVSVAKASVQYSCSRQRPDGSWTYAEGSQSRWIDSFHTGYNLSAIKIYRDATHDSQFDDALAKGLAFYKAHFFEPSGRPKYFHDRALPIDIQCAAQAIDTLTAFSDADGEALDLALRVAHWTINHMQAADGHFCFRDLGWMKVRTPMLHWGQATMIKALALLLNRLSRRT